MKMENEVFGYGGIKYTLDELKQLCPQKNELDETNKLYEFTKRHFESVYNSKKENLPGEIWARLTQKDYGKYLISNFARVKVERDSGFHLIEQEDEQGKSGYLLLNPKEEISVDRSTYVYTLVAYAFLGKVIGDKKHVHHIDNNGYNCRPENLILLDADQHSYVHGFDCRTYSDKQISGCN